MNSLEYDRLLFFYSIPLVSYFQRPLCGITITVIKNSISVHFI